MDQPPYLNYNFLAHLRLYHEMSLKTESAKRCLIMEMSVKKNEQLMISLLQKCAIQIVNELITKLIYSNIILSREKFLLNNYKFLDLQINDFFSE